MGHPKIVLLALPLLSLEKEWSLSGFICRMGLSISAYKYEASVGLRKGGARILLCSGHFVDTASVCQALLEAGNQRPCLGSL